MADETMMQGARGGEVVPVLPLRDTVLFPQAVLPLTAGRESSLRLVEEAARRSQVIGVFTQRDPSVTDPQQADLHRVGTIAAIHKVVQATGRHGAARAAREDAWDLCRVAVDYGGVEVHDCCFAFPNEERWLTALEVLRFRFGPEYFEAVD